MASRKKLSSREALLKVLNDHDGGPMTVNDLVDAALPLTNLKGKTPRATLSHVLYVNPKMFEKTGKGEFKLVPQAAPAVADVDALLLGDDAPALDEALQAEVAPKADTPAKKNTRKRTAAEKPAAAK